MGVTGHTHQTPSPPRSGGEGRGEKACLKYRVRAQKTPLPNLSPHFVAERGKIWCGCPVTPPGASEWWNILSSSSSSSKRRRQEPERSAELEHWSAGVLDSMRSNGFPYPSTPLLQGSCAGAVEWNACAPLPPDTPSLQYSTAKIDDEDENQDEHMRATRLRLTFSAPPPAAPRRRPPKSVRGPDAR